MKVFNQGTFIRVTADRRDLFLFAQRWPCSGIDTYDRMSATFQKDNGDLVDLRCSSKSIDGGAEVALIQDMREYAIRRNLLSK